MLLAYTCTRGTQEVFRIRRIRPRVADCSDVRVVVEFPVRDRARRRRRGRDESLATSAGRLRGGTAKHAQSCRDTPYMYLNTWWWCWTRGRLHVEPTRHLAAGRLSFPRALLPRVSFSVAARRTDRPKRRGNPGGSVPPPVLPLIRGPSKCIAHRGLGSAINCYAEEERKGHREGWEGRDSGDLEGFPLAGHLIRFASRYNVLHARCAGRRVSQP